MKWYKYLYVGESLQGKEKQIKDMIKSNLVLPYAYVITLAANPANLMDVIPAKELAKSIYPKDTLWVLGLAGDKAEALGLVQQIIEDAYRETGDVDVKELLRKRLSSRRKQRGGGADDNSC